MPIIPLYLKDTREGDLEVEVDVITSQEIQVVKFALNRVTLLLLAIISLI
jgi:hypothetical protein